MGETWSWDDEWLGRAPCLVGGCWVVPEGTPLPVTDPYRVVAIGEVADAGTEATRHAVGAAEDALHDWSNTASEERAELLERVADRIDQHGTALARLVSREMGMPIRLAQASQADLPATVLRSYAAALRDFTWVESTPGSDLVRVPLGVVAAITPWNMPVHQQIAKIGAALAAGNTVVLKPSELTPFDASAVAGLFAEAGCPPGVLNVLTGTGAETGEALVGDPRVAHVSFTGSVGAGRRVAQIAAENLASTTLELGGKSPAVILPDAELSTVVPAAVGSGLINSGQACNATTRLIYPEKKSEEVERLVAATLENTVLGDPTDPTTALGPLVSPGQRERVIDYIGAAERGGARRVGGSRSHLPATGHFVEPVAFADVREDDRLAREEVFGPVIALQSYSDTEDAVRIANAADYGLSAEVWSADHEHAATFARRLRVGQVKINGVRTRERPDVPFGGFKQSGYGRELGPVGLAEMTTVTAVMR